MPHLLPEDILKVPAVSVVFFFFERVRNHNKYKRSRFLLHELERADVLVKQMYDLLAEKQQKARNDPSKVKELVDTFKQSMTVLDEGIAALGLLRASVE